MKDSDLLSISQFSELTGIKQSVLRHYDEVELFKPIKRDENGYRYYSAPQTISVNLINVMHSANIPIKTIKEFIRHREPEQILNLFHKQEFDLNRELLRLQQAYSIIHTYCEVIDEGLHADERAISIKVMEAVPIELGPENDFSSGYMYDSFFEFLKFMDERNISTAYPTGGVYNNFNAFVNSPGYPNRYFSHAPIGRSNKDMGEYAVGYARGYYGQLGDLPSRMQEYVQKHDYYFTGPVYEMHLFDEVVVENPEQYLIQVSVPVKKHK